MFLLAAGCYQPSPPANAPCGPGGECPSGLACVDGVCTTGKPIDDAPPPVIDAPVTDATPLDGIPLDAFNTTGCSDGEREGFANEATFPTIAGCGATWADAKDMRAAATGAPCGDDLGACAQPADACAPGWHVCGFAGQPSELSTRATQLQCVDAGGADATARFASAMSHCTSFATTCVNDLPMVCAPSMDCSESVCCGTACRTDQGCVDFVYPVTPIAGLNANGCGAMLGTTVTGVLCCN